jgi:hypothetical protein
MAQSNSKIGEIMKMKLDQNEPSITFNNIWHKYKHSSRKIFGFRRVIAIPGMVLIALICLTLAGFKFTAIVDKTDYPFVDDQQVIGKWQAVDLVKNIDDFSPDKKTAQVDLDLNELVFLKEGETLGSFNTGNGNLAPTAFTWTQGLLINEQEKTAGIYNIKDIDNSIYMFVEWKNGDYTYLHRKPYYFVLKKVDNLDYSNYKVTSIEDKVDYLFVDDPQVIGEWQSVDFVRTMDEFEPGVTSWRGDLFLTQFDFAENGILSGSTSKHKFPEGFYTWTNGLVLDKHNKTASKYEIKEMKGDTYLFFEWKSGDYTFRGMKPAYYVLKKVK